MWLRLRRSPRTFSARPPSLSESCFGTVRPVRRDGEGGTRDGAALRALAPRHIHCAGFYSCGALRKTLPALLASAKALGATISLDTNNDASGLWGEVDGLWATLLPMLDLFNHETVDVHGMR